MRLIQSWKQRFAEFLFPAESDSWLTLLRVGLGLQVVLYCLSISSDWTYLFAGHGGLISRSLSEAILSLESPVIPRLGWLVRSGAQFGIGEETSLSAIWICLLCAGCLLLIGFLCRPAAIVAWFLHLAAAKSGDLTSYGVDNFTTIGLFYLMLSPLPDRYTIDARWFKKRSQERQLLGFWRRVLQTHMCFIYFFGGIAKATGMGWWDGSNLWRALIRPPFNLIDPHVLVHWKFVFPVLGISIFLLEATYPLFIWPKQTRSVWLALICAMHLGIGLSMGMYLFALVMIVLNLAAFGPGVFWRGRAEQRMSIFPSGLKSPND